MSHARRTQLFCALILSLGLTPQEAFSQGIPEYEVYAIEYAYIGNAPLAALVPGADSASTIEGSYMVWLIKGPEGRNILVDAGYRPDVPYPTEFPGQNYVRPDGAVAKVGVSPEEVSDIILTHLHWDHADGTTLFPNAHVWVQKAELEYYAAEAWQEGGNSEGIEPRNMAELVDLNTQGRVTLVDGDDQEIVGGITVYTGPRHTYASQYVGVNTDGGIVVLASDCVWFYSNLELGLANSLTFDPEADVLAQERMKALASNPDWIIPGHDRKVFEKFPNPVEGVARIR